MNVTLGRSATGFTTGPGAEQASHWSVMSKIEVRDVSQVYRSQVTGMLPSFGALLPGRLASGERTGGQKVAVDGVSFSIEAGEHVGIIGSNGAGKSTLLRMIAGLAAPTSGQIAVNGHVTAIFTLGLGLREDLTGRENIYIDGELQGKRREDFDGVVDEIIAFADIGEFIDYPLRTYSTGMKARLGFSMLIHIDPDILIVDETLSAGDAEFFSKAHDKMKEISGRGRISIIVSHKMQSIVDLCTRCLWMEDGRVVMDGDPTVVTGAYLDAVRKRDEAALVARFQRYVGSPSLRPGCAILGFDVGALGRAESQTILYSGEDTEFHVGLQVDVPLRSPELRFRIERLDGLLLVESLQRGDARAGGQEFRGTLGYRIAMRPLVLGPGVYRATVELLELGAVAAMRSIVFEVVAKDAPTGGKPALLYPCSVGTQMVA